MSKNRVPRLLAALESRLEALTEGLEQVDVTGKGIELIKEIKELHAILHNLQQSDADAANKPPSTLMVVWGGPSTASSTPPRGTKRGTASGAGSGVENRIKCSAKCPIAPRTTSSTTTRRTTAKSARTTSPASADDTDTDATPALQNNMIQQHPSPHNNHD